MISPVDLAAWCGDRAREYAPGTEAATLRPLINAAIQKTLDLLADPNVPQSAEVLSHIDSRRKAILRKEAGEVGK